MVSVDVFTEPVGLLMSVALEEWIDGMVALLDVLLDVALVALLDVLFDVVLVATLLDVLLDVALVALLDVLLDLALVALLMCSSAWLRSFSGYALGCGCGSVRSIGSAPGCGASRPLEFALCPHLLCRRAFLVFLARA